MVRAGRVRAWVWSAHVWGKGHWVGCKGGRRGGWAAGFGCVLADADLPGSVDGESLAAESLRPLETEFIHQGFTSLPCTLAQGPTWGYGLLQHRAYRRIHGAEEELKVRRALDLDQRVELVHLQSGVLLVRVAQEVRHDGLVVRDVGAQRDGDGLAKPVFWYRYPAFTVVMLGRSERGQPAQQPHDPQQNGASGGPGRRHS